MSKSVLAFFVALPFLAFASEKYGVYDLQGNRISVFEAEQHELPEKTQQAKAMHPNRNLYISSLIKGKNHKPIFRYRYKAEMGAYIEASRKETFSICPNKEIQGTWISEHSVSLNADNCISVMAPNLSGTFRVLFLQNSGRTDTIRVLVEQSYIQMGDYSHRIWVPDSMPSWCESRICMFPAEGHYESRSYSQHLIVDKTKLTMGDAQHYSKVYDIEFARWNLKEYPKNEKLEESKLPFLGYGYDGWRIANARSKKEGLDTVYHIVDIRNYNKKDMGKLVLLGNPNAIDASNIFVAVDTLAFGYRLPSDNEWIFLMRAGASTRYYWGDEEDSLTVSRYAWVRPVGLRSVAQRLPNRFGLYDMVGLTNFEWVEVHSYRIYSNLYNKYEEEQNFDYFRGLHDIVLSCGSWDERSLSPECDFIKKIGPIKQFIGMPLVRRTCTIESSDKWKEECVDFDEPVLKTKTAKYEGFRLLRKTPKLHKLEKM